MQMITVNNRMNLAGRDCTSRQSVSVSKRVVSMPDICNKRISALQASLQLVQKASKGCDTSQSLHLPEVDTVIWAMKLFGKPCLLI